MANTTTPSNENAPSVMQGEAVQTFLKFLKDNGTLVALVVLVIIFSFWDESFFTPRNLTNLARQTTIVGIIAVGMTLVIIINGIDLSVGSIVGLAAIVVTLLMQSGVNIWAAILITLFLTGFLVGIWNGFWIAHYNIPPFIITLGMMTIARGVALTLSGGGSVPVTDATFAEIGGGFFSVTVSTVVVLVILGFLFFSQYRDLKQKQQYGVEVKRQELITATAVTLLAGGITLYAFTYRGLPYPVAIFAVIVFFGTFMLQNTKFGRRVYAMGGNEEAARLSGISIYRMKLGIYCIITTLSALAGILLASRLNGASPNLGNMFELDAISAVIIGGTSFSGGVGTIVGTVIGAFIISVLNNGMSLLEVPTFYQLIIKGLIIILAVWFDVLSKKKRG
ncbi:MAG: inner-membrane translocator [Candidatus Competibacter sp.]|jgi:D-xylose transport system permease protein